MQFSESSPLPTPKLLTRQPNLVIFDCDGVLVDSETPMHAILREDLEARGLSLTPEQCLTAFMGKSIDAVIKTANMMHADLPHNWHDILYKKVHARLREGVTLVAGVVPLIDTLIDKNIPFCVASNGSEKKIELMLSQHGLWGLFKDRCYSAHTLGVAKPNPALLGAAITRMGANKESAVVIEDSPIGVLCAANADIPCLVYDAYRHKQLAPLPKEVRFDSMKKIADHIRLLIDAD